MIVKPYVMGPGGAGAHKVDDWEHILLCKTGAAFYMQWIKKHLVTIVTVMVLLLGVGLLGYPAFSDWWNSFHQSRAVISYVDTVSNLDTTEYDRLLAETEEYNRKIAENGINWMPDEAEQEEYKNILNIDDSGIMGYIEIPKINVELPIYHGVEESVLQVAIGHIEGSSMPVGGESTHCVISGHRGLPSAKLFTDLDRLVEKDTFIISVLNRTLTYEVDQIRIVEPSDLSDLTIVPGEDYCTLVTCTPYGINTHRLLVRGHRIENAQGEAQVVADATQIDSKYVAPFIGVPLLVLIIIIIIIVTGRKRRIRKSNNRVKERFGVEKL